MNQLSRARLDAGPGSVTALSAPVRVRVSVVMPAFDAAAYVARAIYSVLNQTEQECEILVVDDCSRDATPRIVQRIAALDRRVTLLRNARNCGPAAARNRGLEAARGEWIALLDADDTFLPERLETLLAVGEQHEADLVSDNILLRTEDGSAPDTPMLQPSMLSAARWIGTAEFVAGNIGSRHTPRVSYGFLKPLIRRNFLRQHGLRYDERNRFSEDFLLYLACLMNGARWFLTPEPLYVYSVRPGSLTDVQSAADLQRIRSVEERLLHDDPQVAADPQLAEALRRHKSKIDRFYYYRAFADAVRTRAVREALAVLLQDTHSFRHITLESLQRAPRIILKALRGGYFRGGWRHAVPVPAVGRRNG